MTLVKDTNGRGPVIYWDWHSELKLNSYQQKGLETTSKWIPRNCWGCSWKGPWSGSSSQIAKILLTSPKLQKEKEDLSYGCPIIKLCHVQCKKDTYHIIKNTATPLLNNSINHLKASQCIIVTDKARQLVQACLVPSESTDIHINAYMICVTTIADKFK
jgi:hypothetical protein